jgi:biopolymer transport protein ExbD
VVLLLLFFFMVSTTFNQQTSIKMKLPEANSAEAEATEKSVALTIDADGAYYLEGEDGLLHEVVNRKMATLRQALLKFSATATQTPFIIKADNKTPHQAVITALEAAGAAGFTHISFAAQQTPAEQ